MGSSAVPSVDMQNTPDLPGIWSRSLVDVPAALQANVDAVVTQVCHPLNLAPLTFVSMLTMNHHELKLNNSIETLCVAGECCSTWLEICNDQQHFVELGVCDGRLQQYEAFSAISVLCHRAYCSTGASITFAPHICDV